MEPIAPAVGVGFLVWRFIRDDPAGASSATSTYEIDYAGVVLLTVVMLVMVAGLLAINQAGKLGIGAPSVLAAAAAATAAAVPILVITERRVSAPVIQLKLFANRVFSSGVGAQLFVQIAHGAWDFLAPFLLIDGIGHSASFAGLMILPFHLVRLVFSPLSGTLSDRLGTRLPSAFGHLTFLDGLLALTMLGPDPSTRALQPGS